MFISNNHAWFHLWWKEKLVKHQEVSKSYKKDCRREYVTLKTSFIQATRCQCCHNHLKSICFKERASTRSWTNVHYLLDSCHVMTWSKCHMTFWMGSPHSSHHPNKFVGLAPCESEEKIFLICHVTTRSNCHVNLWVGFPHHQFGVLSCDHVIEVSCDFLGVVPSSLLSLGVVNLVKVEI